MAAAGSEIQMATVARSGGQQQGSVEAGPHQQDHQQQIQQELLVQPLQLPAGGNPTPEFALHMQQVLLSASERGVSALHQVLPPNVLSQILKKTRTILDAEPTLVEIQPPQQQRVTVVGDTHGQYHDLCHMFDLHGHPSASRIYIFNGDYVDRGAWGVETLTLLLTWKWALPHTVYLLRGNHEGSFCTKYYGFMAEVAAKYGSAGKLLYKDMIRLFASLPLAAVLQRSTLVLHGGLFRAPPKRVRGQPQPRARSLADVDEATLGLGSLEDLMTASKGGVDPDPEKSLSQLVASDIVWSDPSPSDGHRPNRLRGVGTVFGPDITQQFLAQNNLRLIIRSHEGPDARHKRAAAEAMPSIHSGYSVDHEGPAGKLVTLFSAPDYPQFMAEDEQRYHNRGAVIVLSAPDYATPEVASFEAVLPRPAAVPYYDLSGGNEACQETDSMEEEHSGELCSAASPAAAAASHQQHLPEHPHATHQGSCSMQATGTQQDVAPVSPTAHTAKKSRTHKC